MSNRKPYVREMKRTWWNDRPFYRFYMLREATVLPLIFFTICMLFGLGSLVKGPVAWASWLDFMANPIIIALNILALAASLFHAQTFFSMMPQVIPVSFNGKKLDKKVVVLAQWAAVAAITLLVMIII